jgi:hypothetical protein
VAPGLPGVFEDKSMGFEVKRDMKGFPFEFRVCQDEPGVELWVDTITITRL